MRAESYGRSTILAFLIGSVALQIFGIQPLYYGLLMDTRGLALSDLGLLSTSEAMGALLGSSLSYWAVKNLSLRQTMMIGAGLAILGSGAITYADNIMTMSALRIVCGCGTGILYATSIYVLGRTERPDMAYGAMMVAQTILWALYAWMLPAIHVAFGARAAIFSPVLWFAGAMVAAIGLPPSASAERLSKAPPETTIKPILGQAGIAGMTLLLIGIYSLWAFVDRVGRGNGLTPAEIGSAFAIGSLWGIPGGLGPMFLGRILPRLAGAVIGCVAVLWGALMLLYAPVPAVNFMLGVGLVNFGWVFGLAYIMAITAANDASGRLTRLMSIVPTVANIIAPMLAMMLIVGNSLTLVFYASFAVMLASIAVLLFGRLYPDGRAVAPSAA